MGTIEKSSIESQSPAQFQHSELNGVNPKSGMPLPVVEEKSRSGKEVESEIPVDTSELQCWNKPRRNAFRVAACFFSFIVFGMNDGAYGVSFATDN